MQVLKMGMELHWERVLTKHCQTLINLLMEAPMDAELVSYFVSNTEIAKGSNGTVVLEGVYERSTSCCETPCPNSFMMLLGKKFRISLHQTDIQILFDGMGWSMIRILFTYLWSVAHAA
ncbi:hypothetical protein D5086_014937 [Populus alba]|uniref:Uncharacterized protein n=1 Tax=Populus alba TaxID=43335 RepID=A0ACC4C061_POPAL